MAWATNKGINGDRRIKQHWNVETGCSYIPWADLEAYSRENAEFVKWAEGGILDEESLPAAYIELFKKHAAKLEEKKSPKAVNNKQEDMELDDQVGPESGTLSQTPPASSLQQPQQMSLMMPALPQSHIHQGIVQITNFYLGGGSYR